MNADEALASLTGKLVWGCRRGVGTFLMLEFGDPHLVVREPIKASDDASDSVRRLLQRRRAHLIGDWHLWIQEVDWRIATPELVVTNQDSHSNEIDVALEALNGQILKEVYADAPLSWHLHFDLGGHLSFRASSPDQQILWSVHPFGEEPVYCERTDGAAVAVEGSASRS